LRLACSNPVFSQSSPKYFRTATWVCCQTVQVKAIRAAARLIFSVSPWRALPESFFGIALGFRGQLSL
jgi:hypothetical protein